MFGLAGRVDSLALANNTDKAVVANTTAQRGFNRDNFMMMIFTLPHVTGLGQSSFYRIMFLACWFTTLFISQAQ